MQPDATFYAVLIEVVGAAGDLKTAHDIFADAGARLPQKQVKQAARDFQSGVPQSSIEHTWHYLQQALSVCRDITPPFHQSM